jgi:branched-chain amino acid transport system ATP-binding protein
MLRVVSLSAAYGAQAVLRQVSFEVAPGELVAVLGRNGSGRSTLAKALMGLVAATGRVSWQQHELAGLASHHRARLGLGYVPESRDAFASLSVHHNLLLGLKPGASEALLAQAYDLFPALKKRQHNPAGVLSGGEQQMLSLARALMGQPGLLIADEPCEGLAPQLVEVVGQALAGLRAQGVAVLLIEQKLTLVHTLADRVLLMGRGEIVFDGSAAALQAQAQLCQQWLDGPALKQGQP